MLFSRKRRKSIQQSDLLLAISVCGNLLFFLYWLVVGRALAAPPFTVQPLQWHGGHPTTTTTTTISTNNGPPPQTGSCYCNAARFCLCTPSLAIDLVIQAGDPDHVWLVRRADTGQLAVMGGFVQVGESVQAAVSRELHEEMGLYLTTPLVLLGVYSDPRRDARRHTVSVVYAVQVDSAQHPVAADDAKQVERIALDDIESHSFFADHQAILLDFRQSLRQGSSSGAAAHGGVVTIDIARSLCQSR